MWAAIDSAQPPLKKKAAPLDAAKVEGGNVQESSARTRRIAIKPFSPLACKRFCAAHHWPGPSLVLASAAFATMAIADPDAARWGEVPRSFQRLRPWQMLVPVACLLARPIRTTVALGERSTLRPACPRRSAWLNLVEKQGSFVMPEYNPAMPLAEMKKVLRLGVDRELTCAFGNVKSQAALLLDPKAGPTILMRQLTTSVPDLKEPSCGKALRDPENANHLQLSVNRWNPGTAKRLTKTLHGTGIRKVSILLEEKVVDTAESEEADDGVATTSQAARPPSSQAAGPVTSAPPPSAPTPSAPIPQSSSTTATTSDPATGTQAADSETKEVLARLAHMAQALTGAAGLPPDQKTAMVASLHTARASATSGDLTTARNIATQLEQVLAASPTGAPGGSSESNSSKAGGWAAAASRSNPAAPPRGVALGRQPVDLQAKQGFAQVLHLGQTDIQAAQALPAHPALASGKQNLTRIIAEMSQKAGANDYPGATKSAGEARSGALQLLGLHSKLGAQQQTYDRMKPVLDRVEKTYFSKPANDSLRLSDLKAGPEFQAYIASVSVFEHGRTPEACDGIRAAARGYLLHYQNDLSSRQQNTRESQAKVKLARSGYIGAGHMKMALQMKQMGPPPWDEDSASIAASMRAAFSFESSGQQAKPLEDAEGKGVSASFWLQGYKDGSGDPEAAKTEFLFKPAAGEEPQPGFPRGSSAPREAISKSIATRIGEMTGLDLGVPETNLVSIEPHHIDLQTYNASAEEDARLPTNRPLIGSVQQYTSSRGLLKKQPQGTLAAIPPEQCQKAAVLDILTMNCDRHEGNFMVGDGPDTGHGPTPTLVPIDHGLTFPTKTGLKERAAERMNNPGGNALLTMPGSFQPFSADMVSRVDMLDPDALAQSMQDTISSLDRVQPELKTSETVPPECVDIAKRAAMFLKRAARTLSPAEIQIALGSKHAEIFEVSETGFAASADAVIASFAGQRTALEELCVNNSSRPKKYDKLKTLGWHDFPSFSSGQNRFRAWMYTNATLVLDAYDNNKQAPQGWVKPT